jgi:hypothetical protein
LGFSIFERLCKASLMVRSKSTQTIRFDHLLYEEDTIGVTFHHSKSDQEGRKAKYVENCYSKPLNPLICLFLAFGIYFACNFQLSADKIFPGSNQRDRFVKALASLI